MTATCSTKQSLIILAILVFLGVPEGEALAYVGPGAGGGGLSIGITGILVSVLVATMALCLL